MKKYFIGLGVIMAVTLGLVIYTLVVGAGAKQDAQTAKKAQTIADSLNTYVSQNQTIPDSLQAAGITDAPSTIQYTKLSDSEYKFCVVYHTAGSYSTTSPTDILTGLAFSQGASSIDSGMSSGVNAYGGTGSTSSELFLDPVVHNKGANCQTVKPYIIPRVTYNTPPTSVKSIYDYNYLLCGEAGYDVLLGTEQVASVDVAAHSLTLQTGATTKTYTLDSGAEIFDSNCIRTVFSSLAAGQSVTVYQKSSGTSTIDGIYITKPGMAQPTRPMYQNPALSPSAG